MSTINVPILSAPGQSADLKEKSPVMAVVHLEEHKLIEPQVVEEVPMGAIPCIAILGSLFPCSWMFCGGCFTLGPKQEAAVTHCGVLTSLRKEPGCHCTIPCGVETLKISTKQVVLDMPSQKVADGNGNPVNVSAVLNYRVSNSKRALLNVQNVQNFVSTNAQATLKQTVGRYSYDQLKGLSEEVNEQMRNNLVPLVECAGVEVTSIRLNDLSYAPEVAAAMLKIQQARALIQARELIVEGAVRISQDAVIKLQAEGVIELDAETKAKIITNILTVTCGENNAVPTVALH